ncbi:UvrD-helicase domain-containing protein [Haladaptatus sp. YSMS36]|uniref:UvrD-helicase domain-containing protein n=1 Tax=Haladaptatus sp. YSMS36 TaxID=3033384 RepID=UPI0023E7ECA8|nr:UvrD-helicase domain-containing protein [Haladaptatus sp. YSMS36]
MSNQDKNSFLDYERVGLDVAAIGDSCKLNGKPGAGKTTELFGRLFEQVIRDNLSLSETAVITYRKELAESLIQKMLASDAIETENLNRKADLKNWGTAHAVAKRNVDGCNNMAAEKNFSQFCEEALHVDYYTDDPWANTSGKLLRDVFNWVLQNHVPANQAGKCPLYDTFVDLWDGHPNINRLWSLWQEFKDNTDDYRHNEPLYDFEETFYAALEQEICPDVKVLVIDELHDAYPTMFKLLEKWSQKVQENGGTVIVAGDELQVINRHQGADAKYFNEFDLPEIHLPISYRVPEEHWALAKRIISRSFETPDITAARDGGYLDVRKSPTFKWRGGPVVPRERGTPSNLLDEVPEWVLDNTHDNSEGVMFLTRTRRQAVCLAMDLRREGILFTGSGGTRAWSWSESPYRVGLYNILQKLKEVTTQDVAKWSDTNPDNMHHALVSPIVRGEELLALAKHTPARLLKQERAALDKLGNFYLNSIDDYEMSDLTRFVTDAFWEEMTCGLDSLGVLIRYTDALDGWIRPALEHNTRAIDPRTLPIKLYTIHASKGGEAEWVFLYDGVTKTIKNENLLDPDARKNEDRVWYVGTTRSKHGLIVLRGGFDWTYDHITE